MTGYRIIEQIKILHKDKLIPNTKCREWGRGGQLLFHVGPVLLP